MKRMFILLLSVSLLVLVITPDISQAQLRGKELYDSWNRLNLTTTEGSSPQETPAVLPSTSRPT